MREVDKMNSIQVSSNIEETLRNQKVGELSNRLGETTNNLLDQLPVFVWKVSIENEMFYLNKRGIDFTGCRYEELLGRGWIETIYSEDIDYFDDIYRNAVSKKEEFVTEVRLRRYDGTYRWCIIKGCPYYALDGNIIGFIGTASDITEKKEKEYEIRQSQRKYHSLFMNMNSGYAFYNIVYNEANIPVDLRLIEVNDTFEDLCGKKKESLIGTYISHLCPQSYTMLLNRIKDNYEELKKGMIINIEEYYATLYDRWFSFIIYSPEENTVVTIVIDITPMKTTEIKLIEAKEKAEAANKAKSEFLASMSHEIRTPINSIVGMIDLTLMTNLNETQKDKLKTAKSSANSLLKIINDILDFSKMEAGKVSIQSVNFDIWGLIEKAAKSHSSNVYQKGLKLEIDIGLDVPRYLIGDPYRLFQVINNLMSNSLKFTEKGFVKLIVRKLKVTAEEVLLKFIILDTGIGIAPEDMKRLFQSFSQVENDYKRKYNGTGLGLVISKQLIELMGGNIGVKSKKGKGSTFFFRLHFKNGQPVMEMNPYPLVTKSTYPLNILLVEDDKTNQLVIKELLMKKGHKVYIANCGYDAVSLFKTGKFDVILMDIQMPEMDGLETAKKIKKIEKQDKFKKHTPIIAITAYAFHSDKEKFLKMGMDGYISKPIQMEELFQTVDALTVFHDINSNFGLEIESGSNNANNFAEIQNIDYKKFKIEDNAILKELQVDLKVLEEAMINHNNMILKYLMEDMLKLADKVNVNELKEIIYQLKITSDAGNIEEMKLYIKKLSEFLITTL